MSSVDATDFRTLKKHYRLETVHSESFSKTTVRLLRGVSIRLANSYLESVPRSVFGNVPYNDLQCTSQLQHLRTFILGLLPG